MTRTEAYEYLTKMIDLMKENNKDTLDLKLLELLETFKECVENDICETYCEDYLFCPNCGKKIDRSVFYD